MRLMEESTHEFRGEADVLDSASRGLLGGVLDAAMREMICTDH
jgi:hypothetical protein